MVLAFAVLTTLSGCSALRLGYNQGPTLVYWWFDAYADFNGAQSTRVKELLADWFRWHRGTQLPDYVDLLRRAESEVLHDVTPAQVCRWLDDGRARLLSAAEHAIPAMAEVALTLTPAQVKHVEQRYAKSNEDFTDDYLQDTPEERHEASVKRTVERAETLYGRLDDAQRERIVRAMNASPFDPDLWMAERRARQQEVLATLGRLVETHPAPSEAQQAMRNLVQRFNRPPSEEWQRYEQRLLAYNCNFAAELHNSSSAAQRDNALKRLKGWEADLRSLNGQLAAP